jgi:hypothetical protein
MVGIGDSDLVVDSDARRAAWNTAHCRHPTSLERPRWRNYVLGTEPKARRLDCNSTRSNKERCGWEGRYFKPRRIPARAWSVVVTVLGYAIVVVCFLAANGTRLP